MSHLPILENGREVDSFDPTSSDLEILAHIRSEDAGNKPESGETINCKAVLLRLPDNRYVLIEWK